MRHRNSVLLALGILLGVAALCYFVATGEPVVAVILGAGAVISVVLSAR